MDTALSRRPAPPRRTPYSGFHPAVQQTEGSFCHQHTRAHLRRMERSRIKSVSFQGTTPKGRKYVQGIFHHRRRGSRARIDAGICQRLHKGRSCRCCCRSYGRAWQSRRCSWLRRWPSSRRQESQGQGIIILSRAPARETLEQRRPSLYDSPAGSDHNVQLCFVFGSTVGTN